jgi:kynurenine formamidase
MSLEQFLSLARNRRTYDLGLALAPGIPHGPNHSPFLFSLTKEHGQVVYREGASTANDIFSMGSHVGTHIDALGHASKDGLIHGGVRADEIQSFGGGLRRGGVDEYGPIITRGVLLDLPAVHGRDELDDDHDVTARDLEEACRAQGVAVEAGDAVLIRTGLIRRWPDHARFHANPAAGLVAEAAEWLGERRIRCTGSDNYAYEKVPARGLAVHVELLVRRGIPIIEMLNLEELAHDRVYTFLFVALPLKIVGGTGSPIRPVALA